MPPQWKILRDWTHLATGKPDLYVYDLVTQFITPLNAATHCADLNIMKFQIMLILWHSYFNVYL